MKAVFVDTAGWMACADGNDPAHNASCEARDALLESGHVLITTGYVMDETLTLLRMRLGLAVAKAWGTGQGQRTRQVGVDRCGAFGESASRLFPPSRQAVFVH